MSSTLTTIETVSQSEQPTTTAYPSAKQTIWLLVIFFLAQVPAALPMMGFKAVADSLGMPWLDMVGQTLSYVIGFLLTIWYAFRKRGTRELSFASVPVVVYIVAALGLIAMGFLAEPLVSAIPMPESLEQLIKELFTKNLILSAVIAAPILEEILFRGILLDGFLKRYSAATSIIWSGLIFGFIHLIPAQALNAAFIGIALGWLYYRTRSLWLCMFLHFVNNALSSLVFLFDSEMDISVNMTREWVGSDGLYAGILVLCAAVLAGSYVYLNRILPKPQTN